MRMRPILGVLLFCSFVLCGYKLAIRSWGGVVYVYLGKERAPAAVHTRGDLSPVSRRALGATVQEQLIADADIDLREGWVGIFLGNPLLRTHSGNEFACRVPGREGLYDRIEMSFVGVGISNSGETGEMIVEAPCESVGEPSSLRPIWIPVHDIVSAPAPGHDVDLQTEGESPVNIRLRQIPGEWPPSWVLSRVKMYRQDDGEYFVEVDALKMREARSTLLSFDSH